MIKCYKLTNVLTIIYKEYMIEIEDKDNRERLCLTWGGILKKLNKDCTHDQEVYHEDNHSDRNHCQNQGTLSHSDHSLRKP